MKLTRVLLSVLPFLGGVACVGPDIDYGEIRSVEVMEANPGGYRLSAGDQIEVVFAYHPERSIPLTVRPDGKVSMPFAEEILAAGRTIPELDAALTEEVAKNLKNPDLAVVMRAYARQRVYVGGEVQRPSERPLIPGETVYQAIAASGWFLPTAAQDSVVLIRQAGPDVRQAMKFDFSEEALVAADVQLQPFDVIYVPPTTIARVGEWIEQHINNILPRGVNIGFVGFTGRRVLLQ